MNESLSAIPQEVIEGIPIGAWLLIFISSALFTVWLIRCLDVDLTGFWINHIRLGLFVVCTVFIMSFYRTFGFMSVLIAQLVSAYLAMPEQPRIRP